MKGNWNAHLIFIDKNHPPNGLDRTILDISEYAKPNTIVKKLFLAPIIEKPMNDYPLSASFLF